MNAQFNLLRFSQLMRREILVNLKNYIMVAAFIFGLFFLIYFISIIVGEPIPARADSALFYVFLMAGCAVYTSMTFADVKRPVGYFYLTIPASTFEKLVSKWIITVIGWVIAYSLAYFVFATLGKFTFSLIHGGSFAMPEIILIDFPGLLRGYLITHAVYFLGASIFKKNAFVLTIVSMAVIGMVTSFIAAIAFKIFGIPFDNMEQIIKMLSNYIIPIIWVTIILFWTLAYNRLRKTQL